MARAIYSHVILSGALFSGPLTFTNTVAGQVVVIRSMDAVCTDTAPNRVDELRVAIGVADPAWATPLGKSIAGEAYHWEGRQCLETGDELAVGSFNTFWEFIASGYILTP